MLRANPPVVPRAMVFQMANEEAVEPAGHAVARIVIGSFADRIEEALPHVLPSFRPHSETDPREPASIVLADHGRLEAAATEHDLDGVPIVDLGCIGEHVTLVAGDRVAAGEHGEGRERVELRHPL